MRQCAKKKQCKANSEALKGGRSVPKTKMVTSSKFLKLAKASRNQKRNKFASARETTGAKSTKCKECISNQKVKVRHINEKANLIYTINRRGKI